MNRPLSHKRPAPFDRFWFGAAWYPEHWDPATRARDPERMAAAGFNLVRMAEFAWNLLEPEEGRFDFSLFDEAIARLAEKGISTLLCTPTATPPRWLSLKHPDLVRVDADGRPMEHGSRQHACHAHPAFREHSRRITAAMAEHWRGDPRVVGWQTDNEFYCHFRECHCASCQVAFQDFLRKKFRGDIDALNRAWGTAFWALTYRDFPDIRTPKKGRPTYENPAHQLDYHRHLSDLVAGFQREQVKILRAADPRWFITHNGTMPGIDYRGSFTRDLDVLGVDIYPLFDFSPETRPAFHARWADAARSWSGNFIVPEQQSGPGGQAPYFHDHPEPGELRKMTYVSIARGADSLLYFRWRTCRFGAEEYWCGILDHDDVPRRRYDEVRQVGEELKRVGPEVLGTSVAVEVALAGPDFTNTAAHGALPFGLPSPDKVVESLHAHLYGAGYATGMVHPSDDLAGLKLLVVPHWPVFDPAWLPNLDAWVRAGGTLVLGARTATRDLDNNVVPETIPGCLRELVGLTVAEYGRKNLGDERPIAVALGKKSVRAEQWYEILVPAKGTRTLATWKGRHLAGLPAATLRPLGRGAVVYVGAWLTLPVFRLLLPSLAKLSGLRPLWPAAPRGVEVVRREGAAKRLWFFINHLDRPALLRKVPGGTDLLTGKALNGSLRLAPNAVSIIKTPA
jgi:beta-galactosidase